MQLLVPGGESIALEPETSLVLGHDAACDVHIPEAHPQHARIVGMLIEALAPCTVGGVPLEPGARRLLVAGCPIEIAQTTLTIEEVDFSESVPTRELALRVVQENLATVAPTIVVAEGPNRGTRFVMRDARPYLLGRGPTCDFRFPGDPGISRVHLELRIKNGLVAVRDVGATQGVFLGDARIAVDRAVLWEPEKMLRVGDNTVLALLLPLSVKEQTDDYVRRQRSGADNGEDSREEELPPDERNDLTPPASTPPVETLPPSSKLSMREAPTAAIADVEPLPASLGAAPAIRASSWPGFFDKLVPATLGVLVLLCLGLLVWILK